MKTTISTRGTFENLTFRNTRSLKDFIERNEDIDIPIAKHHKFNKEMDVTHQTILNPYSIRNVYIN
jgi:hypothetical protein